jgi:hypothetical protein
MHSLIPINGHVRDHMHRKRTGGQPEIFCTSFPAVISSAVASACYPIVVSGQWLGHEYVTFVVCLITVHVTYTYTDSRLVKHGKGKASRYYTPTTNRPRYGPRLSGSFLCIFWPAGVVDAMVFSRRRDYSPLSESEDSADCGVVLSASWPWPKRLARCKRQLLGLSRYHNRDNVTNAAFAFQLTFLGGGLPDSQNKW